MDSEVSALGAEPGFDVTRSGMPSRLRIALPPTLSGPHTIAHDLDGLADARDPPLLEETKQSHTIGRGLALNHPLIFCRDISMGWRAPDNKVA
jgi:hypothetical protein